jgi:hypothetical protein
VPLRIIDLGFKDLVYIIGQHSSGPHLPWLRGPFLSDPATDRQDGAVWQQYGVDMHPLMVKAFRALKMRAWLAQIDLSAAYGRNQRRRRPSARRIDFKETVAPTFEEVNHRT